MSTPERMLGALTRLYPRRFRERFRPELLALHRRERLRIGRERGRLARLAFDGRTLAAVVPGILSEWLEVLRARARGRRRTASRRRAEGTMRGRLDVLLLETRLALRSLARSPGLATVVVLTLGLGLGANTAMFEVADELLVRPPPYLREPATLHELRHGRTSRGDRFVTGSFSWPWYRIAAEEVPGLEAVAAHAWQRQIAVADDRPFFVDAHATSASFWSLFDMAPALGRFFGPDEDRLPGGSPVAVLAHGFWVDRFGADPGVLGRQIEVGGVDYTIIGVAPPRFRGLGLRVPDLVVPLAAAGASFVGDGFESRPGTTWLRVYVRPVPGREESALGTAARAFAADQARRVGEDATRELAISAHYHPVQEGRGVQAAEAARLSLWLLGTSAVLALIACVNVATLMTGRALRRRRENAVRAALGQGAGRVFVAPVLESLLLAALAGLVAVPLGQALVAGLTRTLVPDLAGGIAGLGARSMIYGAAAVLAVGLVTAAVPALQNRRADPASMIRASVGGGRGGGIQPVLPGIQAALSALLLVAAGLFVRSVAQAGALPLGYDADRILVADPQTSGAFDVFRPAEASGFSFDRLERAVAGLPGVERVTVASAVPFLHSSNTAPVLPGGEPAPAIGDYAAHHVHPGYFETVGTAILRGRGIDETDVAGAPPVMVVSESLARVVWPAGDALGSCAHLGSDTLPCVRVVGIAADIRRGDLTSEVMLQLYVPWAQDEPGFRGTLLVRTAGPAEPLVGPVRAALQEELPASVLMEVRPLAELVGEQRRTWSVGARIFGAFGLVALAIAAVGLFSVATYDVARRRRELGIRAALGAAVPDLVGLVVRKGLAVTAAGVLAGLAAAALLAPRIEGLLFGVEARDPATFAGVGLLLLASAVVATLTPALRAARVDPSQVLDAG